MNEYTIQVSDSRTSKIVSVRAANWSEALDKAMYAQLWANKGKVLTQNGMAFTNIMYV